MGVQRRGINGQLDSTQTAIVTAAGNVTIQPTKLILFGATADTDVKLYTVRDSTTTQFDEITSVALGERVDIGVAGVYLYDGDSLEAESATADRINFDLSYNEITGQ
jgi:hypothetical protein